MPMMPTSEIPRVCLLVLGDIGRSPRMQYHARSLAEDANCTVDFVGYCETEPLKEITTSPKITIRPVRPPWRLPTGSPKIYFLAYAPFKVLFQLLQLLWILLFIIPRPDYLLVQNPPSIPTLFVAQAICFLRGVKLIIDWHNLGYSILALNLKEGHPVVSIARWFERRFGRDAHSHICVTNAMADFLRNEWDVQGGVKTLYDRAPAQFKKLSPRETHELFVQLRIEETLRATEAYATDGGYWEDLMKNLSSKRTMFTEEDPDDGGVNLRKDRPALIVSSTSWTEDEDFSLLLVAAGLYDEMAEKRHHESLHGQSSGNEQHSSAKDTRRRKNINVKNVDDERIESPFPYILMIITGKGPLKEHYEERIRKMPLKWVRIVTAWLAMEDYPKLLGSADLGVSLHDSSSGLDLPMKVVDMFGCGLPVCAVDFKCLNELVHHNQNGLIFKTAEDLAGQLKILFEGFSLDDPKVASVDRVVPRQKLKDLQLGTGAFKQLSWSQHWNAIVRPMFMQTDDR